MKIVLCLLVFGATMFLASATEEDSNLCYDCVCQPTVEPVCGIHKEHFKLRGFASRCIFECTNTCRHNVYEYIGRGRCGKYMQQYDSIKEKVRSIIMKTTTVKIETAETTHKEE